MNDRKIKYVDLNGLRFFADELRQYLNQNILNVPILTELKIRVENLEDRDFYKIIESLDKLPNPGLEKIIYLVPNNGSFLEYLWVGDKYEQLGSFTPQLSLDQYLKIEDSPFEKGSADNSAVLKGGNNKAKNANEVALGKHNISNSDTQFSIGIGTSDIDTKNAVEVKQNGDVYITGIGGYDGTNPTDSDDLAKAIKNLIKTTYTELVNLRNTSKLTSGSLYRITDYITTTTQSGTQSAGHPFDVIVLALSESELSERAWAIHAERDTDGYFANSKLEAWQIWYCLDNDASRFDWAVPTSSGGKGVIYRMIDEYNNDCPYDFKNIMFKHPIDVVTYPDYYYTFTNLVDAVVSDKTLIIGYCYGNIIKQLVRVSDKKTTLNNIVFINTERNSACYTNVFSDSCYNNGFGNDCFDNSFGDTCHHNSFGDSCTNNSFGMGCRYNSFGIFCANNSFGEGCANNTFENGCYRNSFCGATSEDKGHFYQYNHLGDGVANCTLLNGETAASNHCVQNYDFAQGLQSQTIEVTRNLVYETKVALTTSGELKKFNLADLA